jgi:HEAT repeat protein
MRRLWKLILASRVDDPEREVRLAAAVVLGGVGGEEAGRVLCLLLADADWNVRRAAEGALRRPARGAP